MKRFPLAAAIGTTLLTLSSASNAATVTDDFLVQITLTASCTITTAVPDMDFGSSTEADVIAGSVAEASVSFGVTCTNQTPYAMGLNNGANSGSVPAGGGNRAMASGNGSFVGYDLYQTTGTSTPWGAVGSADEQTATGTGVEQPYTIFGTVPGHSPTIAENIAAGVTFTDTVTLTVDF